MVTLVTPVKVGLYHTGTITMLGVIYMPPLALSGDSARIRIQQDFVFIKTESFLFIIRTIQSIGVLKFFDIQIKDDHRIAETNLVTFRKWNHGVRFFGFAVKKGNDKVKNAVDKALKEMREDGSYQTIYKKWFGD